MSRIESLRSLESLLETFLEKAVASKENRLSVLDGLNQLDEIVRFKDRSAGLADEVGNWLAEHVNWLERKEIRAGDANRVKEILKVISEELQLRGRETKMSQKIRTEIDRWQTQLPVESKKEPAALPGQKMVLHRGPESTDETDTGGIGVFTQQLKTLLGLWEEASAGRKHVLSALDDLLKKAYLQHHQGALLLSGFIIYYLRQNGYLVEPYVKRLKAAESLIKKGEKTV